jgi:hypothetical protein
MLKYAVHPSVDLYYRRSVGVVDGGGVKVQEYLFYVLFAFGWELGARVQPQLAPRVRETILNFVAAAWLDLGNGR